MVLGLAAGMAGMVSAEVLFPATADLPPPFRISIAFFNRWSSPLGLGVGVASG